MLMLPRVVKRDATERFLGRLYAYDKLACTNVILNSDLLSLYGGDSGVAARKEVSLDGRIGDE